MDGLCSQCEQIREIDIITEKKTFTYKDRPYEIDYQYCKCKTCGDEFLDPSVNPDPFAECKRRYNEEKESAKSQAQTMKSQKSLLDEQSPRALHSKNLMGLRSPGGFGRQTQQP